MFFFQTNNFLDISPNNIKKNLIKNKKYNLKNVYIYTTVTQALPMVVMFVYGSKRNEQSL